MESADNATPKPTDHSPRETLIRDLYAVAGYYVAHPELPVPDSIVLYSRVATAADVDAIAARTGGEAYGYRLRQTSHLVPGTGIRVTAIVTELNTSTGEEL